MSQSSPLSLDSFPTFPEIPPPVIERPQILYILDTLFESPADIVVVDGEGGAGKTVIASQFAQTHHDRTFCIFTTGVSATARSLEYLLSDLADQIHLSLYNARLPDETPAPIFVQESILKLHKTAARQKAPFYFVVDGLLQLHSEAPEIIDVILNEYLPTGLPTFRFLLTGPVFALPKRLSEKLQVKTLPPPGFSPDEARQYLSDLITDPRVLLDINKTFRGVPGKLASVRRLVSSGSIPTLLADSVATSLTDLFSLEWQAVDKKDDLQILGLAIVAHARHSLTLADVAKVAQSSEAEVKKAMGRLSFVVFAPSGDVEYISPSFKHFAAQALTASRTEVINRILDQLFSSVTAAQGDLRIPDYLEAAGRPEDVVRYLTPDYLSSVCGHSESLAPVRLAVEQGVRAAREVKDYVELMKFSLERAVVGSLNTAAGLSSEISARLSLRDRDTAVTLARSATLREDRLQLLAMVARHDSEHGASPHSDLVSEISRLADSADLASDPKRALKIAGDLLFFAPNCALKLLDVATKADGKSPAFDIAVAQLSLLAAADVNREESRNTVTADDIAARISNPEVRRLTQASCALVNSLTADDVLTNCERIPQASAALYFLGNWTAGHPNDTEAWKVIQYALDRMLKDNEYTPEARAMRMLASSLPQLADSLPYESNQLLKRIDAQRELLQKRGPTVEYVRLSVLLARTEGIWDTAAATQRLEDLYYYVSQLDLSTQTEAFAWFLYELTAAMPTALSNALAHLVTTVEQELLSAVDRLLSGTAEQYQALRGTVQALAGRHQSLAKQIISTVNVRERRDALRRDAVMVLASPDVLVKDPKTIANTLSEVESEFVFEGLVADVLEEIAALPRKDLAECDWTAVLTRALGLRGSHYKFRACAAAYRVWCQHQRQDDLGRQLVAGLNSAFHNVDSDWDRIEYGFSAAAKLAEVDSPLATDYLGRAYKLRTEALFAHEDTVEAYLCCVRLSLRAFAGLAKRKVDLGEPMRRIANIIAKLPSHAVRAVLWSEAACWCFANGASEIGVTIVDSEIRPLLRNIEDSTYVEYVISKAAPALFFAHRQTALEQMASLKQPFRDAALASVCWFILRRTPVDEPFDGTSGQAFSVRYQELVDIVDCLAQIDADHILYSLMAAVARGSTAEAGLRSVTRDLRLEIARRLEQIAKLKLPDKARIQHDGYIVSVEAQLCRMRQAGLACWEAVEARAELIRNDADRSLVFGVLAEAIPAKFSGLRQAFVLKSKQAADAVPSIVDRIGRLSALADVCADFDAAYTKKLLREGMDLAYSNSSPNSNSDTRSSQLRMIDLAYRIEPEFASSLVSATDDDPARERSRRHWRRRFELNEARRKLLNGERVHLESEGIALQRLSEFAWMMLGGLHSGRVESFHWEAGVPYIEMVQRLKVDDAYPVLAWIIQNSVERHYQDAFGADHIRQMFEASTFCCDLAAQLIARASGVHPTLSRSVFSERSGEIESITIHAGERGTAMRFVEDWLWRVKPGYLKICDPYFGPQDLDLLKLVRKVVPKCHVDVLTSEQKQRELGIEEPYERTYREYWSLRISDQDPPDTDITVAGVIQTRKLGIHDRWWVATDAGLAFGGSLNSLGFGGTTRITVLSAEAALQLETEEIDPYLTWQRRVVDGQKVRYQKFSLPG